MRLTALAKYIILTIIVMSSVLLMKNLIFPTVRHFDEPSRSFVNYGGSVVWGTVNPPTIINPILTSHSVSAAILDLLFDPLVRIDRNGKVIPGIAYRWNISDDQKTYTFYLRKGIRFHDGVELTADDVKYTFDQIANPKNESPWRTQAEVVEEWRVVSRYIIEARLREPFALFLDKTARVIAPRHLWEGKDLSRDDLNFAPIGTGAFCFKSWDRHKNEIILTANRDYFQGRPHLDQIVVRVFKNNTDLWSALMRNEVDVVKFINYDDYKVLSQDPFFKVYAAPTQMYFAIVFDMHDGILVDKDVRKAISLAINRSQLMESAGLPKGPFQFPDGFEAWGDLRYDPIEAKLTLEHRGWTDKNHDGILEKAGRDLELRMLVNSGNKSNLQVAAQIRQQLAVVGIKLLIIRKPNEDSLNPDFIAQYRPQLWLRMFSSTEDSYETAKSWYSLSSEREKLWSYKNQVLDQLFNDLHHSASAIEQREIYRQICRIIAADSPICLLFSPMMYHAVSHRVQNTEEFYSPYMPGYLMKDWYIH